MEISKKAIGFPALKNSAFIADEIRKFLTDEQLKGKEWYIETAYHFGGYARYQPELIDFIRKIKKISNIQLDPIYTGKMMYGIYDLIKTGKIKRGTIILAIHTGGLQGITGFEKRYNITL